jgi:glycosyltransferase involved in cell wall biosynthesis
LTEVQRSADILLLALGFDTGYPEIVRTAVPTKVVECLVSGRPILVYSPPDSILATIAQRDRAATLVSVPSHTAVADALRRIIDDPRTRDETVAGAWRAAERYHSPKVTSERFVQVINGMMARSARHARRDRISVPGAT